MPHSNIPKQVQSEIDEYHIKQKLHAAATSLQFSEEMKQAVLQRAKPSIWEREITIPIPALAIVIVLMIGIGVISYPTSESNTPIQPSPQKHRIIDMGTGIFWESDIKGGQK